MFLPSEVSTLKPTAPIHHVQGRLSVFNDLSWRTLQGLSVLFRRFAKVRQPIHVHDVMSSAAIVKLAIEVATSNRTG
jgi:hypothetical protein